MSTEPSSIKGVQLLQQAIARAVADDEYRQRLRADPKGVLREEGLEIADDVELNVHENAANQLHLVLPSRQVALEQLDVDEVDAGVILEWGF